MQRKRLLMILLALAALIIAGMLIILLLVERPFGVQPASGGLSAFDGSPAPKETAAMPLITLPITPPQVLPTLSPDDVLPTGENTPIDTVKRYLDRWNAKDADGMDACLAPSQNGKRDHELENIDAIEVLRITALNAEESEAGFPEALAEDAHARAIMVTDYTVHYSDIGKSFFMVDSATREEYKFWLVQEAEDGPWLIALQGY